MIRIQLPADGVHWSPCRTQENVKQNKIKWFDFVESFQMKRKEVTKTFLMTLNWKNPLVSVFYEKTSTL